MLGDQNVYMLMNLVSFSSFVGLVERGKASDKLLGGVLVICDAK